jgi:GntR family transcriptional regulator of arabinose operon
LNKPAQFLPLYEKVKRQLRDEIDSGMLAPGEPLPSQEQLSARFKVSAITMRRALQDLARDGVVKRVAGVGTFVRDAKAAPRVALLLLGFEDIERWKPRSKIFGDLMAGIGEVAWESWTRFSVVRLADEKAMRDYLLEQIAWRSVDGLLIKPNQDPAPELLALLDRLGLPFVMIKRPSTAKPVNSVVGDDYKEAEQLTAHLIERGYRRIGFIGPPSEEVFRLRFGGYVEALKVAGIAEDQTLIVRAEDYDIDHGARWTDTLLEAAGRLDAVFCGMGAYMGRAVLAALRRRGLRVPDDIAFVMHDPDNSGESFDPPVTSAGSSNFDLGHEGATLLNRVITARSTGPIQLMLPPHVVIRQSTPWRDGGRQ